MDEQKKQKVLLAVLGVAILGAGSYYFVLRDTGGAKAQVVNTGPVERKAREVAATDKTETRRAVRETETRREEPVAERRVRDNDDRAVETRRRNRRSNTDRTKKKVIAPAA